MRNLFLLLSFFISTFSFCQTNTKTNREVVFRSVNVIPMDQEKVLEKQDVVVKGGIITALGKTGSVKYGKDALIIDGNGKYLMPGLAEMHAHVPPNADEAAHKEVLLLFAANGVTTIRGMLGHPSHLSLRSKINSGEILGPRFITSGPSLNGNTVKTPKDAEDSVISQKKAGYDFMKLHPGLLRENFAALVKKSKELNHPFAGHVSFDVNVWRAIDAEYATIDHMDGFIEGLVPGVENMKEQEMGLFGLYIHPKADQSKIPTLIRGLKDHNVWVVPTQALTERWMSPQRSAEDLSNAAEMVYMNKNTANSWLSNKNNLMNNPAFKKEEFQGYLALRRKLIHDAYKAGVGFLLGSDAPQVFNVPGFSAHHELAYLVDAGLTPFEALQTGTSNVGKFLKRSDIGVITKGAVSDLILLSDNPLTNIANSRKIEGVMMREHWMNRQALDSILSTIKASK